MLRENHKHIRIYKLFAIIFYMLDDRRWSWKFFFTLCFHIMVWINCNRKIETAKWINKKNTQFAVCYIVKEVTKCPEQHHSKDDQFVLAIWFYYELCLKMIYITLKWNCFFRFIHFVCWLLIDSMHAHSN